MNQSDLPELISESEALRRVNLPSTPRWRDFLRSKLPCQSAGGSTVYPRDLVQELARRIGDFAAETARHGEEQTRTAAPAIRTKGQLIDRRGPSV